MTDPSRPPLVVPSPDAGAIAWMGRFHVGDSPVHRTLRRLAHKLEDLGVPYAVVGAMALGVHGFRRVTIDVDVLVTAEGLRLFKERWLGLGYVERSVGSKAVRDVEEDVRIDFLLAGEYPGDGKPKPVAFPDPASTCVVRLEDAEVLALDRLVELKLASGMTAPHRLKDLADVVEVVRALALPENFVDRLHPYVGDKFRELWAAAQEGKDEDY